MTNTEMKTILANSGVAEADIEKVQGRFDAEKITEIIENSSNPKEAMENLHAFYPELEVSKLEEQLGFIQEQFEAAMSKQDNEKTVELTEKELDMVSGGGFFDWWENNWKLTLGIAATVVGTAALLACPIAGVFVASVGSGVAVGGSVAGGALAGLGLALIGSDANDRRKK